MTILATNAIVEFEGCGTHIFGHIQGVTGKAFLRFIGLLDGRLQHLAHAQRYRIGEHTVSARVFVLRRPDAELILPDAFACSTCTYTSCVLGLHAPMATAGGARTCSIEFPHVTRWSRRTLLRCGVCRAGDNQEGRHRQCNVQNAHNISPTHSCSSFAATTPCRHANDVKLMWVCTVHPF